MSSHLLFHVEGVNFDATVEDTDDLSTNRGASLALLRIAESVRETAGPSAEAIDTGASRALFTVPLSDCSDPEAVVRRIMQAPITKHAASKTDSQSLIKAAGHLCLSVGLATFNQDFDGDRAIHAKETALAECRRRQLSAPAVRLPQMIDADDEPARRPCAFDQKRPAVRARRKGQDDALISAATADRFDLGREAKKNFYVEEIERYSAIPAARPAEVIGWLDGRDFAKTFEQIVADPPRDGAIPDSVKNKLCVLYADGNKFSNIRDSLSTKVNPIKADELFSNWLQPKRAELLIDLLDLFRNWPQDQWTLLNSRSGQSVIRLETLLWGGDEFMWVMPAWMGPPVLKRLLKTTQDWACPAESDLVSFPATHAFGLFFCHYKMPIRLAIRAAKDLANAVKEAMPQDHVQTGFAIDGFDGMEVPYDSVATFHRTKFGADTRAVYNLFGPAMKAGGGTTEEASTGVLLAIQALRDMEKIARVLPRSQLHNALRALESGRKPTEGEKWNHWHKFIERLEVTQNIGAAKALRSWLDRNQVFIPEKGQQEGQVCLPGLYLGHLASILDFLSPALPGPEEEG